MASTSKTSSNRSASDDDTSGSTPRSLSGALNGKGHDASIQVFDNDTKMLMYRQDEDGDIFFSEKVGRRLDGAEEAQQEHQHEALPVGRLTSRRTGRPYTSRRRSISENNSLDLYYSTRPDGGDWGAPQVAGQRPSTRPSDDDSPFLSRRR